MTHTHTHAPIPGTLRRLALALSLTLGFVVVEVVAGLAANSLALLTDAAHNLTDALALGLTAWAFWMTTKPAHAGKTFGYHRAGILVALVNAGSLALIAGGILVEGWRRLREPQAVQAEVLIWVGLTAVVINLVTALMVRHGAEHDLNMRSAFLHLIGDVLSTLGAVAAGIAIHLTGWDWLDPLVSVLIAGLILWNAWKIMREAVDILMEATPASVDMDALHQDMLAVEGVKGVHHLHVWSLTSARRMLSAHLVTTETSLAGGARVQAAVGAMLAARHGIGHATLQLECEACAGEDLYCA